MSNLNSTFLADSPEARAVLEKLKATVTTLEGLAYLSTTMQEHHADMAAALVDNLNVYVNKKEKQGQAIDSVASWAGNEIRTEKFVLPAALEMQIDAAVADIRRYQAPVILNYATLPSLQGTQFEIEHLSEKEKGLPEAVDQGLTTVENAWFRTQEIVRKGSGIYKADKSSGRALLDPHGREIDIPYNQFEQTFNDPRTGFEAFLNERGVSATLTTGFAARPLESEVHEKTGISEKKAPDERKPASPNASEGTESVPAPE